LIEEVGSIRVASEAGGRDLEVVISTCFLNRPAKMDVGFGPARAGQAADPVAGVTGCGPQGDRPGRPVLQAAGPFAMSERKIRGYGPAIPSRMEPFEHPPMRNHVK